MSPNERIVGRAIRIGDNVDTDVMIPGAYLNMTDPQSLGEHLFETYDESVARRVGPGDIIVAGRNCGMGSSREHAQLALRGRGVQAIVGESFARIFFRNCINLGLPVIEHPEAARAIADEAQVEIDFRQGVIVSGGSTWTMAPQPPFLAELIDAGGLVPWVQAQIAQRGRQ
jgi:3-isopropylmalate/(R)-2-methylmalate dehydratase small subunit